MQFGNLMDGKQPFLMDSDLNYVCALHVSVVFLV